MKDLSLADRLKHLRESTGTSAKVLAQATRMSEEQILKIERTADASINELIQISRYFKADLNWFILGTDYAKQNMDYVVLIDKNAAAGYLSKKHDPTFFSQLEYYRIPGFNKSEEHRIFLVQGESMYPTFSESDYLVCSQIENVNSLSAGDLAVFVTSEGVVVKRIRFDKDEIILESDNPRFKAYPLETSIIDEVWRVEAKVTRLIESFQPLNKKEDALTETIRVMKEELSGFKSELEKIRAQMNIK